MITFILPTSGGTTFQSNSLTRRQLTISNRPTRKLKLNEQNKKRANIVSTAAPPSMPTVSKEIIESEKLKSARGENARRLAKWLAAEWSNREQAIENPPMWAHIHVCFRPLPWNFLNGYSFYTESAYDYDLSSPYKTSIVHLIESSYDDESLVELSSYKIKDAEEFWYGCFEPSLLDDLRTENLIQLNNNCNTIFKWMDKKEFYVAKTKPGKCCTIKRRADPDLIAKFENMKSENGSIDTYLDSTITLSDAQYTAWDIGRHLETDERVWGPAGGAFDFSAIRRFDHLLPDDN